MKTTSQSILANIVKIRNDKGLTQASIAESIEVDYTTYSKTESGQIKLTLDRLANIASCFNMDIVDVITYPYKYVPLESAPEKIKQAYKPKVVLQIELEEEKKEQVLKLVFGENNSEILNK